MSNGLQIPWLTPDDGRWRIDWFGEVAYPGVVRQYRQPCIRVSVSPVQENADKTAACQTDIRRQRNVWVPFGSLAMLRIGDIWQHGKQVELSRNSQVFVDLKITPNTTRFVKAGLAIDESYLLPFSEHPWHRLHTHSYCLAVDAPDDMRLFIPAVELIRFYFGSSSNLLRRLVEHPLKEEALWKSKHFDPDSRHLHLKLADNLSGMSAADIGRIAMDSNAWNAASSVFASCVRATSQGAPAYPCMGFPFQGDTALAVEGMYLSYGGEERRNFLAFRIKQCSHPFPFSSLTYETGDWVSHRRKTDTDNGNATGPRKSSNKKSGTVLGYGDPGAQKKARRHDFDHTWRFSDLKHKSVWQERVTAVSADSILRKSADGGFQEVALGDASGANAVGAVDFALGEFQKELAATHIQDLPSFVKSGIGIALKSASSGLEAKPLLPANAASPVFPLPLVVDEHGEIDVLGIYVEPDGSHRPKRACFVSLVNEGTEVKKIAVVEGDQLLSAPSVHHEIRSVSILALVQLELNRVATAIE